MGQCEAMSTGWRKRGGGVREWVGLTDDELNMLGDRMKTWSVISLKDIYIAIEAKLREKNSH